jgi:NAD(P)-dependent dehydrogenase (short-subunit alcohol dehydrogenase family)
MIRAAAAVVNREPTAPTCEDGAMAGALEGKVVVVAGASTGIGRACAEVFGGAGATLVLLARGRERLEEAARATGGAAVPADVSDPASVRAAFAEVERLHGRVDVLLNVAAVGRVRTIEESTDADIAAIFGTNLLGPVYTTRAAIPLMRRAGGGDIVNVSSESTLAYLPYMVLYAASKAGLDGFTRMAMQELKPEGIRVMSLVAGSTATEFGANNYGPEDTERAMPAWVASGYRAQVAGRVKVPAEHVAETMLFMVTRPPGQIVDVVSARSFS